MALTSGCRSPSRPNRSALSRRRCRVAAPIASSSPTRRGRREGRRGPVGPRRASLRDDVHCGHLRGPCRIHHGRRRNPLVMGRQTTTSARPSRCSTPGASSEKTILTWVKDHFGRGDWLRGQTEQCLLATRGKPVVTLTNQTTVLHAPVRAHSQKPDEFYELVESLCAAPRYCELWARASRPGWDGHGDQWPGDDWQERDAVQSYDEAICEIGKQVKAGAPIPEFMQSRQQTACHLLKGCRYNSCHSEGRCLAAPSAGAGAAP